MSPIDRTRLLFPRLAGLYGAFSCVSVPLMRVLAGLIMMTHGWPKIQEPMKMAGMVEGMGFVPGAVWSPALAITEFFGGLLLAAGFLTRLAATGLLMVLLVTSWYHGILKSEGLRGAELSILWASIMFFFVAHGAGRFSIDAVLKREL